MSLMSAIAPSRIGAKRIRPIDAPTMSIARFQKGQRDRLIPVSALDPYRPLLDEEDGPQQHILIEHELAAVK